MTDIRNETRELEERVLPDDYPMFAGYLYVADGEVFQAEQPGSVGGYKRRTGAAEVRNCDIAGRDLWERAI